MKTLITIIALFPMVVFAYSPQGFVSDFSNILTSEQKSILEEKLSNFEKTSSNEISVVIVPSLDGDYIEHYATKLFEEWGIGKKDTDNGVLLLVALQERKLRIEVGYGLEPYITDSKADSIIRNEITPEFKNGNYYGGIDKGVSAIIGLTEGTYTANETKPLNISPHIILFLIFILFSIMARTKSWWFGGIVGFVLGLIFFNIFITVGLTFLGLLVDYILSKTGGTRAGRMFWGGGGGRGSGGGFGGFSGGSSGGGGSSGSW